jgi:hypothetical protein
MAESVLAAIADNLMGQGYCESDDPSNCICKLSCVG